ncbi:MAG: hypothetical protein WAW17_25810, partial [Rhodococcus sp. (in: high G+C Gram-positive bacteria)]|uniref:hypothetical protein n=1 Tax=Rhodococcus sp. TaxID=1831 RepID=UPI003BAFD552
NRPEPPRSSAILVAERVERQEGTYQECLDTIERDCLATRFDTSAELQAAYVKVREMTSANPYLSAELVLRRTGFLPDTSPRDQAPTRLASSVDDARERGRAAALEEIERVRRGL